MNKTTFYSMIVIILKIEDSLIFLSEKTLKK